MYMLHAKMSLLSCRQSRRLHEFTSNVRSLLQKLRREIVGESARPLSARIKEHLGGKGKSLLITPIVTPRRLLHDGANFDITLEKWRESQTLASKL